jgi:nitroreductase
METWDAIRSRRNVRAYTSRTIPREHLHQVLEAARRSPSARNWQPWDFVVVTDRSRLTSLARVWRGAGHVARSAATVALIAPVPRDEHERALLHFDLGQATMSLMIAATDLGIGSGHASVEDQDLARSILGFPEGRFCAYLVALGYPADRELKPIERPNRRPFEQVVHWEHW